MLALLSAWIGLLSAGLSLSMLLYRPFFNDITIVFALNGAVFCIGCGGLVFMRKTQPDDDMAALASQRTQARVGIVLGIIAFMIVYAIMAMARQQKL